MTEVDLLRLNQLLDLLKVIGENLWEFIINISFVLTLKVIQIYF
jgi:hypothetical protein